MIAARQQVPPDTTIAARQEDLRLVTGRGRFTADWNLPGQVHAHMVRSDRAHARIVSVDWAPVRQAPGVVAVLTADDVREAGFAGIPAGGPMNNRDGQPQKKAPMPVLAQGVVRFVGQPIAMVVADTARHARDAADLAFIEYDELPVAASVEAAGAPGAPVLHEHAPGNLSLDFEHGDEARVREAFSRATHVTTLAVRSQRLVGSPMEPRAILAWHDTQRGKTVVHTPTQGMLGMRGTLASITGWREDEFEVVAQDVGGSFGLRSGAGPEHALVMLAARRLGHPVKWVASRSELFVSEWHGRALTLHGSIALDADGRMLAIRFDDEVDHGAYTCYWSTHIGTRNLSVTMGGVYRVPALYMRSRGWFTNTVPVNAYRGAGRPDIAYAIERLVDQAAAEHGFDPVALRRTNFIAPDAFPYTTANGTVYDSGDFPGVLEDALERADYDGFAARRQRSDERGLLRGIGIAYYLEACGGGNAPKDQVSCAFAADGSITLYGVTGPSGQGHETSFTSIVAQGLGVPAQGLSYRASDPLHEMIGNGTGGSRSLYGAGSAFKQLVGVIIERGRAHAAAALGVGADAIAYSDGAWRAQGSAAIGLTDLARRLAGTQPHPLDCGAEASSGVTYPNGCHIAEVEIDPRTGAIRVDAYHALDDLGNVVSPQLARGQVHGGVVQGIGQAFGEKAVYDPDSSQLLTGSFADYSMPRASWVGEISSEFHPVPTALNALGAKGVGESGCSGSLPALANAVMNALRPLGVPPMDMPFTPARVWQALRDAGE